MAQEQELLTQLSKATGLKAATTIIRELERHFLYTWRPVGDNEANYGLINIGSDPGNALIERVTNALWLGASAGALHPYSWKWSYSTI